ncbi:unnamed protein product, partial [marine sediment metagenome]
PLVGYPGEVIFAQQPICAGPTIFKGAAGGLGC